MTLRTATIALAALLAAGTTAGAQEQNEKPLTWIAYDLVQPGKLQQAIELTRRNDGPLLDRLLADGTIQSWGVATPVNHEAGFGWNMLTWVTLADWAGVDTWVGAVNQRMGARSAEESQAIEEESAAIFAGRSHYDEVVQNAVLSPPAAGGARPRYILAGMNKAHEGQEAAGLEAFASWWPVVDGLKAEGAVLSYGIQSQALHTDPAFTHRDWYMLPSLASIDAITAAAETSWTQESDAAFRGAFDVEAHRDVLLMILHLGGQPAE